MDEEMTLGERIGDKIAPFVWWVFIYFAWPFMERADFRRGYADGVLPTANAQRVNRLAIFSLWLYAALLISVAAMIGAWAWQVEKATLLLLVPICLIWAILHTQTTIHYHRSAR
jgi:uncharacterized membrane protein